MNYKLSGPVKKVISQEEAWIRLFNSDYFMEELTVHLDKHTKLTNHKLTDNEEIEIQIFLQILWQKSRLSSFYEHYVRDDGMVEVVLLHER